MQFKKIKKTKNIFIYLLSFLASIIGIFLNFFLARVLEAEYYGRIQYLVALATTCSQILIFGLNMFLIRETMNPEQKGETINKCFSLYIVIVLFFVPIMFYVLNQHVPSVSNDSFAVASVLICAVLMGFNSLISAHFQGKGKYHITIIFENLLPKLFLLLTAIAFLIIGKMTLFQDKYLIFYIFFYACAAIPFTIILFRKVNFNFKSSEVKSIFFFFGVTITYSLGNNLTKVLQGGLYHNNVALGIISISISIISLIKVFTAVLDNLIKPIFAKQKRENDIDGLFETYRFETRTNAYIAVPLYLFFIFNPSRFLGLFGSSFIVYPHILSIIAIANAVNDLTGSNGTMLAMTGKERWELFNGFIYFGAYFGSVFLFSSEPIYGLSFALLISQVVVNIAKYSEVWLIYKRNPLNKKTLLSILILLVSNGVVIFACHYMKFDILIWLILSVLIGMALVLLNVFVFSLYRKVDFKKLINLRL